MKNNFFFILCFFACMTVFAQKQKVVPFNGVVEDVLGQPLRGARVWVVNPDYYATTDRKGKFGLTNVQPTDTLHVKYKKQIYNVPVDSMKSVRVRIADEIKFEAQEDKELVNIGYGFVKRREYCSATSGILGEILVRTGRTNVLDALQGLVPGLTISNGKAIIRGLSTINSSPDPLFLVDGVEVESLSFVNVYDVDRVDVLKDSNIYGAKGANGVILVTTKRGTNK
jgi:TonB-dependent SusC/RagA subfamily outer membrane receptor